ncbi:MAG: VIT1/CCC1 family protein [Actinomycetota bacterium]|nr:VIT1/CCC1 family protein [Actinomycetota bacterium]
MSEIGTSSEQLQRFRELWRDELLAAGLYRALAEAAGERRDVFLRLAETEERHAAHWQELLSEAGVEELTPPRPGLRGRLLAFLARRFGIAAVLPFVIRAEAADADRYRRIPQATAEMAEQEMRHGRVLAALGGIERTGSRIAVAEGRHRTGAGGALRAAVFGANDGLVSNFSLVMGVAGGTGDSRLVILAGAAGLFAGAFSMAAGEWVSMRSQRELYEREIAIEAEELAHFPEEERQELELIYQAKGVSPGEARVLAERLMANPATALDTLAREELGVDPGELPSPALAALSSFVSFAAGALLPILPYLVLGGVAATVATVTVSVVALFSLGAAISVLTARRTVRSGLRMAFVGGLAASATYLVGSIVGVTIG